jgi:malate synthase
MTLNMQTTNTIQCHTISEMAISGSLQEGYDTILTAEAQKFLLDLHLKFNDRRLDLLQKRKERQKAINNGQLPDFLPETSDIRERQWKVAPLPSDLLDRRVEITGPVERKMVINALNSGAKVFMADFEDSNTPNWDNNITGQINMRDAINRTISYTNPKNQKHYKLNDNPATLLVRPRGWHLTEKHITHQGEAMSGSLVDFGLYFFHNAQPLIAQGSGPYFYLPKIESYLEARLWNDVFVYAQDRLGIPQCTVKATVLIETILASFQLNEILYELRDHSAGLNCGRWDYIFSYIKKLRNLDGYVLPDRAKVGMTTHFMSSYSQLVIQTCHKRGVHAMGGMAAQIPIKNDPAANTAAMDKVRNDKLLEVNNGHDGTWVAHPARVNVAMEVFNLHMPDKNQIHNLREDVNVSASDLLQAPKGTITEDGLRNNINVGILYIESWLRGNGAAAIYNLMEDAATAEISRTQIWQWLHNAAPMEDGRIITSELYKAIYTEELEKIQAMVGPERYANGRFEDAAGLFDNLVTNPDFVDFLTLPAYDMIS